MVSQPPSTPSCILVLTLTLTTTMPAITFDDKLDGPDSTKKFWVLALVSPLSLLPYLPKALLRLPTAAGAAPLHLAPARPCLCLYLPTL